MTVQLMCIGDSNTRGEYGVGYAGMLAQRLRDDDITVTADGVNGEVSYGLLQRLDPIIEQRPVVVTVLIGTNDVWGTLTDANAQLLVKRCKLPYPPSAESFHRHLESIVTRLRAETDARIAVLSPPVLGQDLNSEAVRTGRQFAEITTEVAQQHAVDYLPLFERQYDHLRLNDAKPIPLPSGERAWYSAMAQHLLLRRSWDRIGERRGLLLTTDHVHQNSRGATIIADLVEGYVRAGITDR